LELAAGAAVIRGAEMARLFSWRRAAMAKCADLLVK
jgi:hypothetical protein